MKRFNIGATAFLLAIEIIGVRAIAQELVFGPETYVRNTAAPNVFTSSFVTEPGNGILKLINGDAQGQHRLSSARVIFNGVEVLGPNNFNAAADVFAVDVPIEDENTLKTELYGAPSSSCTIEVSRAFQEEIPGWRMPELEVTQMLLNPTLADPGDKVSIVVTIQNTGRGPSASSVLTVKVDESPICSEAVSDLQPEEAAEFECTWSASGAGRHLVRAEVQLPDDAFDGSLANNFSIIPLHVSGESDPQPEIELRGPNFNSFAFNSGESYVLPVRIRNASFAQVTNLQVEAYIDGEAACVLSGEYNPPIGNGDVLPPPIHCLGYVEYLGPGEETNEQILWLAAGSGEHTLSVQVVGPGPDTPVLALQGWHLVVPAQTMLYGTPGLRQWASIGPEIIDNYFAGRITSVAFDPKHPLTAYASGAGNDASVLAGAGVWKSTDGGSQWFPVGDKLPSLVISKVFVDPNHTSIIYASGLEGIFKSIDGGNNWSHFAKASIIRDARLFVGATPQGEVLIYAGMSFGLKRYMNADPFKMKSDATDWVLIRNSKIRDMVVHPTDHSTVYISTDNAVYRTMTATAANPSWDDLSPGLPSNLSSVTLDIQDRFPERVYAGIANPGTGLSFGIYRRDSEGDNWSKVISYAEGDLDDSPDNVLYNPFIRVVPMPDKDAEIIYFGGASLYQFINYPPNVNLTNRTFEVSGYQVDMRAGVDLKSLEFLPGLEDSYYWVADDQGIFQCSIEIVPRTLQFDGKEYGDSGDFCTKRNLNLRVAELYDIDVSKTNPDRIIGGTQDTGTILYTGDQEWNELLGGDGLYTLFNPNDDTIMYAQYQAFNDKYGTARSEDGGQRWSHIAKGMPEGYGPDGAYITTAPDYPDIIIGRADGKAIYFHTNPDSFPSVAWGSYPVDTAQYGDVTRILTNVVTPGSNSWWLAGTSKGKIIVPWQEAGKVVFKTVFSHPDGRYVKGLAASPVDPRVIYAAFVGGSKEMLWRIYLDTTDPTASVATDITYNYPANLTPMTVCADPYKVDVIYVGSKKGVMWLDPAATNNFVAWQPFNEGFPLTTVVDLVVSPADKTLLAATKGRGVWRVITGP